MLQTLSNLVVPVILEPGEITVVIVNQSMVAEFDCSAAGIPTPDISWFRVFDSESVVELTTDGRVMITQLQPDNEYLLEDRGIVSQVNSTLLLMNTEDADSSTYICNATNSVGSDDGQFELIVQSKFMCTNGIM